MAKVSKEAKGTKGERQIAPLLQFPPLLQPYIHKELHYRYWGKDYRLCSSQSLFSASQIDRGSQLLLASLLPRMGSPTPGPATLGPARQLVEQALQQPSPRLDVWDWGCGIGVLGLLAQGYIGQIAKQVLAQKQTPGQTHGQTHGQTPAQKHGQGDRTLSSTLHVLDRDALALAFTRANWTRQAAATPQAAGFCAQLIAHEQIWGETEPDLACRHRLVLSNIPAKLGEPVLRRVLPALALTPQCYVAIVLVAPLRHLLEDCQDQIELLYSFGSGDHCIFHYRQKGAPKDQPNQPHRPRPLPRPLELYRRGESCFALQRRGLRLHTAAPPPEHGQPEQSRAPWPLRWNFHSAYGLADFDTPSYGLELQIRLLAQRNWRGRVLIWQPGHGHIACFLARHPNCHIEHFSLAGRDRLGLLFAQHNLERNRPKTPSLAVPYSSIHSLPCVQALPAEGWQLIVLMLADKLLPPQAEALRLWLDTLPRSTSTSKENGSWLCLLGRSQIVSKLHLERLAGCSLAPQDRGASQLRSHALTAQLWHLQTMP